jgi:hypothetical protein
MTTAKVALSIPEEILDLAKKQVTSGRAKSLSAFVSTAIDEKIRRDELRVVLDEMDAAYGAPNKAAKAWAKRVLR